VKTSAAIQLPLLRALGAPAKDKKHVLYEGGHATPVAQPT
jgi:hypothetical protein